MYSANVPMPINGAYKGFARFQFLRDKISFPYWTTDTWRHDDRHRIHDAVIPVRHRRHFNRNVRACSRPSCPPPFLSRLPSFLSRGVVDQARSLRSDRVTEGPEELLRGQESNTWSVRSTRVATRRGEKPGRRVGEGLGRRRVRSVWY